MATVIELSNGGLAAAVDTSGAWLLSLTRGGQPILFERQTIQSGGQSKLRGGCHVCLPNFGPGGNSGLGQHGFGRTAEWTVAEKAEASVKLTLDHFEGDFESLNSSLTYQLADDGLSVELIVVNSGSVPLPLSPGFHPYFATGSDEVIAVDGDDYSLDALDPVSFLTGDSKTLHIEGHEYILESQGLPKWALWSDRLGDYVCLEPTEGGNSFLEGSPPLLAPGASETYRYSLRQHV